MNVFFIGKKFIMILITSGYPALEPSQSNYSELIDGFELNIKFRAFQTYDLQESKQT